MSKSSSRKKSRKFKNKQQENLEYFEKVISANGHAMSEGPKKKRWSMHDLKAIRPLTPSQEDVFHAWAQGLNICTSGSAGTGKTFLSLYLALREVLDGEQQKIIIIRSAVSTREVGHLPGTLEEKIAVFERPYQDIFHELVGRPSTYSDMKDSGVVEFMSTSYIRGITWDNAVIVVDEGENMTMHEIDSILTRVGNNSRLIFNGDIKQTDLNGSPKFGSCGMEQFLRVIDRMESFETITFNIHDIVRSDFVKSWIIASQQS